MSIFSKFQRQNEVCTVSYFTWEQIRRSVIRGGGRYDNGGRPCPDCGVKYANPSSYSKHKKSHSTEKRESFTCSTCDASFSSKYAMKRHISNIHDEKKKDCNYRKCLEETCPERFYLGKSLYEHMEKAHSWKYETEYKTFPSVAEFEAWKHEEDKEHYINMYRSGGMKEINDCKFKYFKCNFDRTVPQWQPDENKKGAWKSGITPALQCPAKIHCRINPAGDVEVRYLKTHNHICEARQLAHCNLPKNHLKVIKEKILQGVKLERIQTDCHKNYGEPSVMGEQHFEKISVISRREIREIERNIFRRRKPDFESTTEKMIHLHQQKHSRVLIYKVHGEKALIGKTYLDDHEDLVILGLQTKEQALMMAEGAERIVCIDSTHNTNRYGYQLLAIIVPTSFRKGYPVAHFIVSTLNAQVLIGIFKILKDKFDEMKITFKPKVVMTDDDKMTGPAFRQIFGMHIRHLLCHWHITTNWEKNFCKIKNQENREDIKELLSDLLEEPSKSEFDRLLQEFEDKYAAIESSFVEYFKTYYIGRQELWAKCYRDFYHCLTHTNMFCESCFNKLKTYYMNRRSTRRLDDLIDILINVARDAYIDHQKKNNLGPKPVLPALMGDRHGASETIPNDHIYTYQDGWLVRSQTSQKDIYYQVTRILDDCDCRDRCALCVELCPHMFSCGCPFTYPLCKHVHKIWTCIRNATKLGEITLSETSEGALKEESEQTSEEGMVPQQQNLTKEFPVVENDLPNCNDEEPGKIISAGVFPSNPGTQVIYPNSKLKKQNLFNKIPKKATKTFPLTSTVEYRLEKKREKKKKAGSWRIGRMEEKHKAGKTIPDDHVAIYEDKWIVRSQTLQNDKYYLITREKEDCECCNRCTFCVNLCPHMFSCGCPDVHSICKHIHKIATCIRKGTELARAEETSEAGVFVISEPPNKRMKLQQQEPANVKEVTSTADKYKQEKEGADRTNFVMATNMENRDQHELLMELVKTTGDEHEDKNDINYRLSEQALKVDKYTRAFSATSRQETSKAKKATTTPRSLSVSLPKSKSRGITIFSSSPKLSSSSSVRDFGPPLMRSSNPVFQEVYRVGNFVLDIGDLKSIDPDLNAGDVSLLKRRDKEFQVGWLTHRVIDAYLHVILKESTTAAITSRWYQDLKETKKFTVPFNITDFQKILVPANPTTGHWVLFVYNVTTATWDYLDSSPISKLRGAYLDQLKLLHSYINPESQLRVRTPPRRCQEENDETNCGVYVCFYGLQCKNNEPYNDVIDVNLFRKRIYDVIVENVEEKCARINIR